MHYQGASLAGGQTSTSSLCSAPPQLLLLQLHKLLDLLLMPGLMHG
jgi:hypothetical protein